MAEAAKNLNFNQQNQFFSPDEAGSSLRENKQASSQAMKTQIIDFDKAKSDILMSRQNSDNQSQNSTEPNQINSEGTAAQDTADSLKQAQQLAKLAANPTVAGAAAVAGEMAIDAIKSGKGGKMATAELLKTWWTQLIDSFGLTLIPLNLQAWAGFIEGHKVFCKLGEEWKAPGIFKKAIGWLETAALLSLDLLVFLIILAAISFLIFIVNVMTHPLENMKILWDLFGGAIDGLL
ncbi:hypothetical protein EOM71_00200 [Candidatus Falkowbacteria bacterium]|jgi:hypothetical protein|nr:hypothetical protein [Candidatus Falkowbacteria bacterium]